MNVPPDISSDDSERLQEFVRVTTREVKAVGGASAATTLDMIGYIRELEHELSRSRAAVAPPVDAKALDELFVLLTKDARGRWCFNSLSEDASKFDEVIEKLDRLRASHLPVVPTGENGLTPCPFCGGLAEKRITDGPKRGFIGCFTCMIGLPFNVPYGDTEVAKWNTRSRAVTPDAEGLADEVQYRMDQVVEAAVE